jgi:hypothetical protein
MVLAVAAFAKTHNGSCEYCWAIDVGVPADGGRSLDIFGNPAIGNRAKATYDR